MKITKSQLKQIIKEELESIIEDGHVDAPSAKRKLMTAIEDCTQILSALDQVPDTESLPSWWMDKITLSANYLNKARDYLLYPTQMQEARNPFGARYEFGGEPEILDPDRPRPDSSKYGSAATPEETAAYKKRQAERDPDREYVDMIKRIMRDLPGMRVTAIPGDERQNRLLDMAEREFASEQR